MTSAMSTLATAGFLIVATSLLTVHAVTFCPFGFSPTNASNGTASRLSVTGLFLALNRPLQCNGTLAAWQYCYRATNGSAQIKFQIWRPNGTAAYSRRHSTSLNKTFSTASGAVVCERVVASANLSVGVFSPNGSVSTVRYIPASSTNSAQLSNNTNVTLTQLNSSLNASLMVYVELLGSSTAIRSTASTTVSTANRSASSSIKTSVPTLAPSWSSAATYLSSSPPPYVARSDNSAQIVAAASASSIIGVFVVVCVIVAVVVAALWLIRSRKSKSSTRHHPPTGKHVMKFCCDYGGVGQFRVGNMVCGQEGESGEFESGDHDNPTYDTADSPKTANKYFDASNMVKQISGKSSRCHPMSRADPTHLDARQRAGLFDVPPAVSFSLPKKKLFIVHTLHSVQSLSRSGQFSAVSKAVWKNGEHRYQVAIKSATVQTQVKEHTLMLQEAAIMGQFIHPNIVSIYGVVNERHSGLLKGNSSPEHLRIATGLLSAIATAIHYLSSRDFVHCDLAARSVFVSEDTLQGGRVWNVETLGRSQRPRPHQGRDQVRWMSPESLDSNEYTSRSDAWSYGCLLYEIWSLGKMPYEDCTDTEIMTIPREDARSHPKATTLGGHLQAGRGMYGDLQSSYASGADDQGAQANDSIYENVTPAWHNGEAVEPVRHGARSLREPGGEESTTEARNDSAAGELYEGMNDAAPQEVGSTEPGEFYEGMDSSVTERVYDSVSVHEEEPTYDVVHDSKLD
eukprot:Em0138g5a